MFTWVSEEDGRSECGHYKRKGIKRGFLIFPFSDSDLCVRPAHMFQLNLRCGDYPTFTSHYSSYLSTPYVDENLEHGILIQCCHPGRFR